MACFGIADEEECAGTNGALVPGCTRVALAGQAPHNLRLDGIGVLELVDEEVGVASGERGAHALMIAQQVAGAVQQLVEVQPPALAKRGAIGTACGMELGGEAMGRGRPEGIATRQRTLPRTRCSVRPRPCRVPGLAPRRGRRHVRRLSIGRRPCQRLNRLSPRLHASGGASSSAAASAVAQ